jgi:hypothetical protein
MSDSAEKLRAEVEYLRMAESDHEGMLTRCLSQLGELAEQPLAMEQASPEFVSLVAAALVTLIRQSGNAPLARRYADALIVSRDATYRHHRLVDRLSTTDELDDRDLLRLDDARQAASDAREQFERVAADVDAWFDVMDRKQLDR